MYHNSNLLHYIQNSLLFGVGVVVASFSKEEDEHCRLSLTTVAKIKAPKIDKVFIAVKEQRTELTGPVELLHDSLMLGTWDFHFLCIART